MPAPRKVHTTPLPRIGGLAVFLSFVATIAQTNLYETQITDLIVFNRRTAFGFYGALVVFGCGLWDDFRRLNPWFKLLFQILGATIAIAGGVSIGGFFLGGHGIHFGIFSYLITVFWFLLFINAVNLIDGLDGLAAGVVFFASIMMVIISVMQAAYLPAIYFAALAGATLGFLRYNFNPASIFLGDGGSYLLGYIEHDRVFTYRGLPIMDIRRSFRSACRAVAIDDFRFHGLRHTLNTNMRKSGVDRSVIMKITGHKTMSMFERYNTVDENDAIEACRRLDEFLKQPVPDGKNYCNITSRASTIKRKGA
jgi:hypothetical protein